MLGDSTYLADHRPFKTRAKAGWPMTSLFDWAKRWNVPWEAVVDLQHQFGMEGTQHPNPFMDAVGTGKNEEYAKAEIRLEAGRKRIPLWRNNVGALADKDGRFVRYGLANDSAAVKARIKSGDLIGIRPVTVMPAMTGHVIGQFVSREVKAPGWHYTDTPREQAQLRWIHLVAANGGDACFATGEGTL
jgi:hypothetical protein